MRRERLNTVSGSEKQDDCTASDTSAGWSADVPGVPDHILEVVSYLRNRGLAADNDDAVCILARLLHLGSRQEHARMTVSRAARLLYMSRRGLGRRCHRSGLPSPSHILAFGRILEAGRRLQRSRTTVFRVAEETGWSDPFSLSNTMHRLTGIRPSDAKDRGSLYLAEAWLRQEIAGGHAELRDPRPPFCPSCGQHIQPIKGR